ncbi:Uncharacterised protein [Anaerobiospirillum thomasii]|uniref:hypothetical protein n=1 Tax=Anaerobiospirillum thomasii TaxID=179995 RepID=UPI000D855F99|nr:hypothetical protein [Anaerobiospirillum thomasii]SPT72492.1 Uncharacterised protein [Anaerobiospirillum thomasii]
MIELGNVQTLTDEKFFASLDGLPYINNSGVYDAVIIDAIAGARQNDPNHKVISLGLLCTDADGKKGRMNLSIDLSQTEFSHHTTNLAYLLGSVDQTGRVYIDDQVKQLPKPLPDGRTSLTIIANFIQKQIKVAVRRSSKTNQKGVPYFSVVAFFNPQGQSAIELARGQQPQKIHEAMATLQSEGNEMLTISNQAPQQQAPAYGQGAAQNIYGQTAQQAPAYGQGAPNNIYGQAAAAQQQANVNPF